MYEGGTQSKLDDEVMGVIVNQELKPSGDEQILNDMKVGHQWNPHVIAENDSYWFLFSQSSSFLDG